jgi:hypothetical protein
MSINLDQSREDARARAAAGGQDFSQDTEVHGDQVLGSPQVFLRVFLIFKNCFYFFKYFS